MPLKSGSSKATISSNIKELMDTHKGDKQIGNTKKHMTKEQKHKQAIAIAFNKAKEGKL